MGRIPRNQPPHRTADVPTELGRDNRRTDRQTDGNRGGVANVNTSKTMRSKKRGYAGDKAELVGVGEGKTGWGGQHVPAVIELYRNVSIRISS